MRHTLGTTDTPSRSTTYFGDFPQRGDAVSTTANTHLRANEDRGCISVKQSAPTYY